MLDTNFTEVKIVDDELSELEILKKLIAEIGGEEPLHMLNIQDIFKKHQLWLEKMPRIFPYYAVKCNPDATVIKLLAALGGCFDCASKHEIIQVMSHGVPADRIIFANPIKFPSHIEYSKKVGVSMMTVDTEDELKKIEKIYPEAKILIRIRCDAAIAGAVLGEKFGCDPDTTAVPLIQATINLKLELYGFSFHVGSPCGDVLSICRGINLCNKLIDTAKVMGCKNVNIIDIGGGIPGGRDFILDEFSVAINQTLKEIDPSIRIIAEPGRYYVTSAFTGAAYIVGKKTVMKEDKKTFMYYVSDGVYGSFIEELLHIKARHPVPLNPSSDLTKYTSTVWGPTCDSYDVLLKDELLPEFHVGDWLAWLDTGSYSTCLSSEFNGFKPPQIYPIVKRNDWAIIKSAVSKIVQETEN